MIPISEREAQQQAATAATERTDVMEEEYITITVYRESPATPEYEGGACAVSAVVHDPDPEWAEDLANAVTSDLRDSFLQSIGEYEERWRKPGGTMLPEAAEREGASDAKAPA